MRWVSADIFYEPDEIYDRLKADSPPNLTLLAADALDIVEVIEGQKFDKVLSHFFLDKLWQAGSKVAERAATQMLQLAQADGTISVAPIRKHFPQPKLDETYRLAGQSITVDPPANDQELTDSAKLLARAIKLPRTMLMLP